MHVQESAFQEVIGLGAGVNSAMAAMYNLLTASEQAYVPPRTLDGVGPRRPCMLKRRWKRHGVIAVAGRASMVAAAQATDERLQPLR